MAIKYVLFIVGEVRSGKSSLIRSLTGCGRNKVYNVKNTSGKLLKAFVSLNAPQEMGMQRHSPQNFPKSIEDKYGINRNDYDVLISALRLSVTNQTLYGPQQYVQSLQNQGFDVRLAVIETAWNGTQANPQETASIKTYAQTKNISVISMDASNDPNEESSRIRQSLYP
jgi:GTPase SAR1 family protein